MSQTLKLTGLEEGGLLTSSLLDEYNGMRTNAAKRRLMLDVLRNGYALEKMGLGPVIELLERVEGDNFFNMSEQDRLRRMMGMISALLGETPAVQPPAPAAAPQVVNPAPVNVASEQPPAAEQSQPEPDNVVVTRNDDDNSSRRVESVRTHNIPTGALKLRGSGTAKRG